MATSIEWTDATWNPVVGCTKVSPGCAKCYAETMAKRLKAMALADIAAGRDPGRKRHYIDAVDDKGRWSGKLVSVPEALGDPLKWRKPRMVFVNSMSDLFHKDVPDEFIDEVFATMLLCESSAYCPVPSGRRDDVHTFQILTKRAERMAAYMSHPDRFRRVHARAQARVGLDPDVWSAIWLHWPLLHVWLGTSVENQEQADARIPRLLLAPAAVRFLSCEPLLGELDLIVPPMGSHMSRSVLPRLDWVIVGGESGPGARPCDVSWIRSIVEQCQRAEVPCFVKQLGSRPMMQKDTAAGRLAGDHPEAEWPQGTRFGTAPGQMGTAWQGRWVVLSDQKGGDPAEWPEDLRVRQFPAVSI